MTNSTASLPMTKIYWRCFHCGDAFTKVQEKWAREHFGRDSNAEPVCLIRSAGESALLSALRRAEDDLSGYREEDGLILRSMQAMADDHARALIREEEKGYARGIRDARMPENTGEITDNTAANHTLGQNHDE